MAGRVIWVQQSFPGVLIEAEEQRWRSVVESPLPAHLITAAQFLEKCVHTPRAINDIVFVGTFATHSDYQMCSKGLCSLQQLRRFALVDAHVHMFTLDTLNFFNVTDLSFRSCRLTQAPILLARGISFRVNSIDLSNNFLSNINSLEHVLVGRNSLKKIDVSRNRFSEFPQAISTVTSLVQLNVSRNLLTEINSSHVRSLTKLAKMDVSDNPQLTSLPDELFQLPSLITLNVIGLPMLTRPPYDLVKLGLDSMREYLKKTGKNKWLDRGASHKVY